VFASVRGGDALMFLSLQVGKKKKQQKQSGYVTFCLVLREISIMNGIEIKHEFVVAYEWIEIKSTNHQTHDIT
jgi:hypothetical protein